MTYNSSLFLNRGFSLDLLQRLFNFYIIPEVLKELIPAYSLVFAESQSFL